MVLFSNNPDELQTLLNRLHCYSSYWGLKVNTAKTKVCVFQKRFQEVVKVWKYDNKKLEVVDSFCYLGLKLYYNGNMELMTKNAF